MPRPRRRATVEHVDERQHASRGVGEFSLGEESQRGRHLVVAAARRVQLGARGTCDLGDSTLDCRVDVFVARDECERPDCELALGLAQRGDDGFAVGASEHTRLPQHGGMRDAAGDVVPPESRVESDARRVRHQRVGGGFAETAVPKMLVGHRLSVGFLETG